MTGHLLSSVSRDPVLPAVVPLGEPIPAAAGLHAVSVSLPTIEAVKGYEEGHAAIRGALKAGYPRFVFGQAYSEVCRRFRQHLPQDQDLLVLPSPATAERCVAFMKSQGGHGHVQTTGYDVALAVFPKQDAPLAKSFWQHAGAIVSSRQSEDLLNGAPAGAPGASARLRRRLGGLQQVSPDDVYLFPTGMAAIFEAYDAVRSARGGNTVQLGFPYTDTWSIQRKFGEGARYIRYDKPDDLDVVAAHIRENGAAAVFCEVPGNPLLRTVDLERLSGVLRAHGVPLVVDNTLGTWADIDVQPFADVVVTSLTKYFSGRCDAMGGSVALMPHSPHYGWLKPALESREQLLYPADAEVLLGNAAGFESRMQRINHNGLALAQFLQRHDAVDQVFYSFGDPAYEAIRKPHGGYGGLLSFTLKDPSLLAEVYDHLDVAKGPSLGTENTLVCPYTLLAHYQEIGAVQQDSGVPPGLIRVAAGVEETGSLLAVFDKALSRALHPSPRTTRVGYHEQGVHLIRAEAA